jgi:hypothetical protein
MLLLALLVLASLASTDRGRAQSNTGAPGAPAQTAISNLFQFNGGNLNDFVGQVSKRYGVDLGGMATIPNAMMYVQVPKIRVETDSWRDVLNVYNDVSRQGVKRLGLWIFAPAGAERSGIFAAEREVARLSADYGPNHPETRKAMAVLREVRRQVDNPGAQTIVLVSPGQIDPQSEPKLVVRAFALDPIKADQRKNLVSTIEGEWDQLRHEVVSGLYNNASSEPNGRLHYNEGAGILVVVGDQISVDMAAGLVEAFSQDKSKLKIRIQ